MDKQDIEIYLKAEKHCRYQKFALIGLLVLEITWLILYLNDSTNHHLNIIATGLAIGFLVIHNSQGFLGGVSRADLLHTIKRQINRDPEALKYLAEQSSSDKTQK